MMTPKKVYVFMCLSQKIIQYLYSLNRYVQFLWYWPSIVYKRWLVLFMNGYTLEAASS